MLAIESDSQHYLVISNSGRWMCPVTMDEFNGCHNFVLIWNSQAVFSEKALKQLKVHSSAVRQSSDPTSYGAQMTECPMTGMNFTTSDIIHLVPDEEKVIIVPVLMTVVE